MNLTGLERTQQYQKRNRDRGICITCGQNPSDGGKARCLDCGLKHNLKTRARYHSRIEIEHQRAADKRVRDAEKRADKYTGENGYLYMLFHEFGMTSQEYHRIMEAQDYYCLICERKNPNGKRLSLDHNHKTGIFRGFLCHKCNSAIGMVDESSESLRKLADYIDRHNNEVFE